MRVLACFAGVVLFALAATAASADGLLYQLPKDGTWARYDFEASMTHGDEKERAEGLIRMASVGRVTDSGQPCRWIEVRFEVKPKKGEVEEIVVKVLVPEKHLAKGQSPLKHVVRAWIREDGDKGAQVLKDPGDLDDSPLPVVLSGPPKDQKELKPVAVRSKLGELSCKGVVGTIKFQPDKNEGVRITIENRLHSKAPFGVVTSRWTFEMAQGGPAQGAKGSFDLKLADFGTGAKSEMPDQK